MGDDNDDDDEGIGDGRLAKEEGCWKVKGFDWGIA